MGQSVEQYIGAGIAYIKGRDVGNVSSLAFSIETESKTRKNYRGGGGNISAVDVISAVKLSATFDSFSNENLALALRGIVDVEPSEAISAEEVVAVVPGLAATSKMIDVTQNVTVTSEDDATTYTLNDDYVVRPAGILAVEGGAITDASTIKVSYQSKAANALEALVTSGEEVDVVFDGVNDVSGTPSVVTVFRWKPSPTAGLDLISDDFATFDVEGEVLADEAIVAAGKSKFFRRVDAS